MARLKSELEVVCPCCNTTLVIDLNLGRVVSHSEPERGNKPELSDAHRLLAEEAARRESIFQQSVETEKTRGDALSRRFEEALKQARQEPITRPPSRSINSTTSAISADVVSSEHALGSRPRDLGVAFRGTRFFLFVGTTPISHQLQSLPRVCNARSASAVSGEPQLRRIKLVKAPLAEKI